jgi:hypothetical protein
MNEIDFASSEGKLEAFDDGHTPEKLPQDTPHQLVHYPRFLARPPAVHVFYDALPEGLIDELYEKTFRTQQEKQTPWGTYVTMEQVNGNANNDDDDDDDDDPVVQATAHYLDLVLGKRKNHLFVTLQTMKLVPYNTIINPLWTREDLQHVHGVAVLALAAQVGSEEVLYHLDQHYCSTTSSGHLALYSRPD